MLVRKAALDFDGYQICVPWPQLAAVLDLGFEHVGLAPPSHDHRLTSEQAFGLDLHGSRMSAGGAELQSG